MNQQRLYPRPHRAGLVLFAGLILFGPSGPASAAPGDQAGDRVYVRAGVLHLAPRADSGEVVLSGVGGAATLAIDDGPIAGSGADVSAATIPAVVIGVVLPGTSGRLSLETIVAAPITVELYATGTLADESLAPTAIGFIPTGVPPLGRELGQTQILPPVLTAVYRLSIDDRVRPYVGAGVTYLRPYDSRITNPVLTEVAEPELALDDAVGAVVQAGIEAQLAGRFFATLDIKYIIGVDLTAEVTGIEVATPDLPLFDSVAVGDARVDVAIAPLVVQAGVGANF